MSGPEPEFLDQSFSEGGLSLSVAKMWLLGPSELTESEHPGAGNLRARATYSGDSDVRSSRLEGIR